MLRRYLDVMGLHPIPRKAPLRHTYAATRNMLLDYRVHADGKTWLQGDACKTGALPELWANIRGTGPLKQLVVVRDNRYIYTQQPRREAELL